MFRTPYKYDHTKQKYAHNTKPSMTVPQMALSIREIVDKFTRGVPVPSRTPSYSDEFIPDIDTLDFVERDALHEASIARVQELNDELKAHKSARLKREQEKLKKEEAERSEAPDDNQP